MEIARQSAIKYRQIKTSESDLQSKTDTSPAGSLMILFLDK